MNLNTTTKPIGPSQTCDTTNNANGFACQKKPEAAFSIAEVLSSATILGVAAVSVITSLLQTNTYATSARLETLASAVALNQIELVSNDSPFSPSDSQIPVDLAVGNQVATVIVYDDPNADSTVTGTMTTTVDDPNHWQNGYNLNLRRITVKVSYRFRNRDYSVTMHTVRASDV